jgi:hypothetical protein
LGGWASILEKNCNVKFLMWGVFFDIWWL